MSDHPTTTQGEPADSGFRWDDHAALHRRLDGSKSNMLRGFNVIRDGSFADMVRFVTALPDADRQGLVIQKSGDRLFELAEILSLGRRDDFPTA